MGCLDDETVVALAEGTLEGDARAAAMAHVESCGTCAALVGQAARLGSEERASFGRYRTIEQIGAGAMGRVFVAYDPALDREVALKLIHVDALDPEVSAARLIEEARTLAELDHPAICRVFDLQQEDDTVFIAMELVRGQTFDRWLAAARPSAAAIVGAFMRAGEGLAAAHEAGVVHRDFKPANVMLEADPGREHGIGRVVVLDFGLARREHTVDRSAGADTLHDVDRRTGSAFAGTPMYMAPEQHDGEVTAASDQYAFCVALLEGLGGRFPFGEAPTLASLIRAKRRRSLRDDVVLAVPGRLRSAVLRGLEPDPQARFSSMRALLDALEGTSRRRWPPVAAATLLLGIGGGLAWVFARPPAVQCELADQRVDAVWNDARREELRGALVAGAAPELAAHVVADLDAHAAAIAAAYRETCGLAREQPTTSAALLDARARCLARRVHELDAAAAALRSVDATTASSALTVLEGVTDVDRCADDAFLLALDPLPDDPRLAADVEAVEAELDRALGEVRLGRHREALPDLERVVEEARSLAHDPLVARALAGLAGALRKLDDPRMVEIAEEAHGRARLVRDHATAADAAIELVHLYHRRGELELAVRWVEEAELDADRADTPTLRAMVLEAKAVIAYARDEFEDALSLRRAAVELHASVDPGGQSHALGLRNIGNTLTRMERPDDAIEVLTEARTMLVDLLGPESARVAEVESELGTVHMLNGHPEMGIPYFERGLPLVERYEGAQSRSAFSARSRLAAAYREADRFEESAEQSRKCIAMLEHIEHSPRDAAITWMNLAKTLVEQRDPAAALEAYEKARGILDAAVDKAPLLPLLGMNLHDSADVLDRLGRPEEAQRLRDRARTLSATQ